MLKIAICDDDRTCIRKYSNMFLSFAKKYQVEMEMIPYYSGEALLFDWENTNKQADALYLDIHMKGISGMQTAKELRQMGCTKEIIFFTRDKDQVFDAFDVNAFHYIVKGVTKERKIEEIFLWLIGRLEKKKREFITFSFGGQSCDIAIDEIRYFKVDVRVVTVHYGKSEVFEFYSSMGKLENLLCSKGFIRTHRSALVNTAFVKRATYQEVVMQDGTTLPVGRNYWKDLKEVVQK